MALNRIRHVGDYQVDYSLELKLIIKSTMDDNKYWYYGGLTLAAVATLFGGLYIKNKVMFRPLSKEKVVQITKAMRKPLQPILQNITKFHEQLRGQVTNQQFKDIVESEEGLNVKQQLREITEKICKAEGTVAITYEKCLSYYAEDPLIKKYTTILEKDYSMALSGQSNDQLFGKLPQISKDKLLTLYKIVTQAQFINTAETFKLMVGKSEQDIMGDPVLVARMNKFESQDKEKLLVSNQLDSEDDSVTQVYNILVRNMQKSDPGFAVQTKNIQAKFQQVFQKHMMSFQQSQNLEILDNLEDELIFMQI